jgi:hypothetical protein
MPQLDLINFLRIVIIISLFLVFICVYFIYVIRQQYLRFCYYVDYGYILPGIARKSELNRGNYYKYWQNYVCFLKNEYFSFIDECSNY